MGVASDGSYGIPEDVIYGVPVTCANGEYQVVKGLEIDDFAATENGRHAQGTARGARRREAPPRIAGRRPSALDRRAAARTRCGSSPRTGRRSRRRLHEQAMSAGTLFRQAVRDEQPLQIAGAINAYHALLAQQVGYRAIYLSGGGVAAGSLGMPDLGISNLDDVLTDVRRITDVCDLPLLVDVDTGFGPSAFNIARTRQVADQGRRRRDAHRRPGRRQALRPPARQGDRLAPTRWSTASRRRSTRAPTRILRHRAHRRARRRRPRSRDRARASPASRPAPT